MKIEAALVLFVVRNADGSIDVDNTCENFASHLQSFIREPSRNETIDAAIVAAYGTSTKMTMPCLEMLVAVNLSKVDCYAVDAREIKEYLKQSVASGRLASVRGRNGGVEMTAKFAVTEATEVTADDSADDSADDIAAE